MKKELTLQDYLQLIQRRKWSILISTGGVVMVTLLYLLLKAPVYQSASTFMLESKELSFTERGMGFKEQTRPLGYYEAVMRSRIFRSRLQGALMADSLLQELEEVNAADLNRAIREDIRLSTSEYSEFIELSARANDPVVAYRLAFHATQILKDRCQEIDREELQNAVNFIDHQQNVSKTKLEEAERALQEFKKRTNITLTDADGGMMTELIEMEKQFTAVQTERELAQANLSAYRQRLAQVQGKESQTLSASQDPEVARIRREIGDLQQQRIEAAEAHGETDESVRLLDDRIERVRRELINRMLQSSPGLGDLSGEGDALMWKNLQEKIIEAELNVFILENKEQYYQSMINEFRKNNPRLMEEAIEFMRMSRAQSVAENLYKFLLERGEEAKIKAATGTGGVRIIDDPVLPRSPVPANMARNLVLGLFLGLGLGFGVALVREFLDHTVQSREDITRLDGLSVMGMIPAFNGFSKNVFTRNGNGIRDRKHRYPEKQIHLISDMKPKSPTVESYRNLRSSLNFAAVDREIRSMVVSSPSPMEGKTVTTANLGISYALLGKKVLIVDADLRKPRQHQIFRVKDRPGLMDHLVEGEEIDKIIHRTGVNGLKLIPCGLMPPNPAELIASKKMQAFMKAVEKKFDLVLYDSAPLLPVSDTLILSSNASGLLLVVRHGFTDKRALGQVLEVLHKTAEIPVIGVVMNQVPTGKGYGYYGYYEYYAKG